jgi:hypothetical protein
MLQEYNSKERQNKLQQLQWKEEGKAEDNAKDGGTIMMRI